MSDVVSFTEIDGQQVDLLPARTLQSGGGSGSDGALAPAGGLFDGLTGGGGDSNGGDTLSVLLDGLTGGGA